jgi:hypothetical protein
MMKKIKIPTLFILLIIFLPFNQSFGAKKKYQEINFSEMDIQGSARTPDGAYLVQRRGLRFLPLYEVKKNLDSKIRRSINYLK